MKITHEQIIRLQKRIDIPYQDAEKLLKKTKNDIDKAVIIYNRKINSKRHRLKNKTIEIWKRISEYKIKIKRNKKIVLQLSVVSFFIFLFIILNFGINWFSAFLIFCIIIGSGGEVSIYRDEKRNDELNLEGMNIENVEIVSNYMNHEGIKVKSIKDEKNLDYEIDHEEEKDLIDQNIEQRIHSEEMMINEEYNEIVIE